MEKPNNETRTQMPPPPRLHKPNATIILKNCN